MNDFELILVVVVLLVSTLTLIGVVIKVWRALDKQKLAKSIWNFLVYLAGALVITVGLLYLGAHIRCMEVLGSLFCVS